MSHRNPLRQVVLVLLLVAVVFSRDAHAYLDPGTGSLVFQTLVAGLAALAYALRSYWGRIRALFSRHDARPSDESVDRT